MVRFIVLYNMNYALLTLCKNAHEFTNPEEFEFILYSYEHILAQIIDHLHKCVRQNGLLSAKQAKNVRRVFSE